MSTRITIEKQCSICGIWTHLYTGADPAEVERAHDEQARETGWEIGRLSFCKTCKINKIKYLIL